MTAAEQKACFKCGEVKPLGDYNIRRESGKPYRQCRVCMIGRRWAERHPERSKETKRIWRSKNIERMRALHKKYNATRLADPLYKLRNRIAPQIRAVVRGQRAGRRTFEMLGYSANELRDHLERQFLKGMTWDNASDWHIDHILPLKGFDFTGPDDPEFLRAWALPNLRPIWAKDNLRKGAKRLTLL